MRHIRFILEKLHIHQTTLQERVSETFAQVSKHSRRHIWRIHRTPFLWVAGVLIFCASVSLGLYTVWYTPPRDFPVGAFFVVPKGVSVEDAAVLLERAHIIKSAFVFRVLAKAVGRETTVRAGEYYFSEPLLPHTLLKRLSEGVFGFEPITFTVPEGATSYQIATLCGKLLRKCDQQVFFELAKDKEGYLFPETYFFSPNTTAQDVVEALEKMFYTQFDTISEQVAQSHKTVNEIVIMASLLEKEAQDKTERQRIAGVLWHRIEVRMPLQVDAVFGYIEGRETFNPKFSDLKVDSPYNTYKYKGLPPGPISNPSLASLEAAATPLPTNALYYLHGRDGVLRLAQTFEEHKKNRKKYLD